MSEDFRKCLVEFIGTFFLVATIGFTGNPFAIGGVLSALIYMGGYISGAHYNPAVTLAVLLRGTIGQTLAGKYMVAQILGGVAAALAVWLTNGQPFVPKPEAAFPYTSAIAVEIMFTFLLASVVLHVATAKEQAGNQFYGAAIGMTILAAAFIGIPTSGGVYNPAVGIGPILVDYTHISTNLGNLILYIAGPSTGAALAAIVFNLIHKHK